MAGALDGAAATATGFIPVLRPGRSSKGDLQAGRLDGQALLDLELVVEGVHELEPLHEHAEHQHGLLHGELPADAGPLTRSRTA